MLESLQAFGPSRIQKIALRSTADGTPACLVTLYQGKNFISVFVQKRIVTNTLGGRVME